MRYILVVLVSFLSLNSNAQSSFKNQLKSFYEKINEGDSALVKSYFLDDAVVMHIENDTSFSFNLEGFLTICPKFKSGKFREEVLKIETKEFKGGLYYADVYFKFYLNDKFLHCGVDHHCWYMKDGKLKIQSIYSMVTPCLEDELPSISLNPEIEIGEKLDNLMDKWHYDVANSNFEVYFGFMDESFIFLGTDPGERWTKKQFAEFSKPYFDKKSTWDFKPKWRNWYFSDDLKTAWFEEQLDTWMEECRGSGVLKLVDGEWKIVHYNLTVLIENEKMEKFIKLRRK